ncbi:g7217 [Coccomyxa viridis]|uniref:G7217 protein n=1 Tax=Coccomyxa viridis TaxID=1274662 RepID=A0ABP1G1B7_9CHLO
MDIDSDDDPSPEEPAADWDAFLKAQAAARELDMSRRKAEAAQLSQPSAAAASEASWRTAAPPARELLHTEARQLGVQDSLLPDNRIGHASRRGNNWMWGGDGAYVPSPSSAVDTTLRLHETVKVFDMGLVAHPARAVLDSGNAGCTLIMRRFAARLGLVDENGRPKQDNVRLTTVHGVVAGASEKVPLMRLNYELQGRRMLITAGVSEATLGCDVLLSRREIAEFLSDGFTFDVR